MLAVIKVYFDGLQMVKIAQIPIVVHGGTCTQPRRNFLFSISSFLDNVKIKIWYGVVWCKLEAGGSLENNTAVVRISAYPAHKGNTTEMRTPP